MIKFILDSFLAIPHAGLYGNMMIVMFFETDTLPSLTVNPKLIVSELVTFGARYLIFELVVEVTWILAGIVHLNVSNVPSS